VRSVQSPALLKLDLRHLEALQAVAGSGSFAAAADALGYTQSAISQQIAALEGAVGQRLVARSSGGRGASLTPAGEVVLRHADAVLARLQMLAGDLSALAAGRTGSLRVGTYQSVAARILPAIVADFRRTRPGLEIDIRHASHDDELIADLERGHIDLAVGLLPPPDGPFEYLEILADPYVLVVPKESPLADRPEPVTPADIAALPLMGFARCRHSLIVGAQLKHEAGEPNWVFRSDDNSTLQAMVGAGVGVALVPRLTVDATDSGTVIVQLGELFPPRRLGVVWHAGRDRPAAMDAFIELAHAAAARLGRSQTAASAGPA
jgi:molybdate transport repressor ModE-like protein